MRIPDCQTEHMSVARTLRLGSHPAGIIHSGHVLHILNHDGEPELNDIQEQVISCKRYMYSVP